MSFFAIVLAIVVALLIVKFLPGILKFLGLFALAFIVVTYTRDIPASVWLAVLIGAVLLGAVGYLWSNRPEKPRVKKEYLTAQKKFEREQKWGRFIKK